MIRFRIGQSWKRERTSPVDGFGLELDGVALLPAAHDEPLVQVVPGLVAAVHRLWVGGHALGQLSLSESHVEVTLCRSGHEVEVAVVSLGRPARLLRPAVRVDLQELTSATVRCGRSLLADLDQAAPTALRGPRRKRFVRQLEQLEARHHAPELPRAEEPGWTYHQVPHEPGAFGFTLLDADDRLLAFDKGAEAPLASILCGGAAALRLSSAHEPWRADVVPFLFAHEVTRQAGELLHAIELSEPRARLQLTPAAALELDLGAGTVQLGQDRHPLDPLRLVRGAFELGLAVAFAIATRNKAQSKNPYLEELGARCREGLAHLKAPKVAPTTGRAVAARKKRGARDRPLEVPGKLKRLRFEPRFVKQHLGEDPGRVLLGPEGPVFSAPELAIGFSPQGELRFKRVGTRGVAAAEDGTTLVASEARLLCFGPARAQARWLRNHDGLPLGPELVRHDGLLIATSEGRGAVAFAETTGRELWRAMPPRTQRIHLSVQAHRALLATDSGYLYGLELADGQIRYRVRAPLPFLAAPVAWGRRMVAVLGRGQTHALFAADAHSGAIAWEQELHLSRPTPPRVLGGRVLIAGERDGDGALLCFGATGKPQWERALHLGHGPYEVTPAGRAVVVTARTGAATLIGADGRIDWYAGAGGEPLPCGVRPSLSRGVLIVPGERVRALDLRSGAVLAEVHAGATLCDLAADARLGLYLLDEGGTLRAFRLSAQLSILSGD